MAGVIELMNVPDDTPEAEVLEVLVPLAHAWEEAYHHIPDTDPIDVIKFAMEQKGLVNNDLEPYIGTRSRGHPEPHPGGVYLHGRSRPVARIYRPLLGL